MVSVKNLYQLAGALPFQCKNGRKIFRFQQAAGFAETVCQLNGQTFAAFGTAGSQYGTAAAGFGTHQKTVGAFAFGNGRLVSTFHVGIPKL